MIGTDVYLSLANVYEAERKALARSACDDKGQSYMQGICALVSQIEDDLLNAQHGRLRNFGFVEVTENDRRAN